MIISIDEIKENLDFAAQIMRRLPAVKAQSYSCAWPAFFIPAEETLESSANWLEPLPYEVSAMEEILDWLKFTKVEYRKIVWLRACRINWQQISKRFRRGRSSVCRDYNLGLEEIQSALKEHEEPCFMREKRKKMQKM